MEGSKAWIAQDPGMKSANNVRGMRGGTRGETSGGTCGGSADRRRVLAMRASPLVALIAAVTLLGTSGAYAEEAVASVPAPPVITGVVTGVGTDRLLVTYEVDPGATGYEISSDDVTWWPCPDTSGTCGLTQLRPGISYGLWLRAINGAGPSLPAGPVTGTPTSVPGVDPDKPQPLPTPRRWVSAQFTAGSNDLGVSGLRSAVGVGALPALTFSRPITDKRVVETHLDVTATLVDGNTIQVPGSWGWTSDRTVVFRPRNFWPGRATVTITSTLDGAVLGKEGKSYLVGSPTLGRDYTFRTARSWIAKVDGAKKNMKVFVDGKLRKTFKVSLGGPEWETRNGVKVISTSKEPSKIYRSSSLGLTDPEDFYELQAPWNTRLTPTGEFIHAAPWAYGRLGRYNGSHGCTNMFENDAKWIFDNSIPGDVVTYVNTGGERMESWNGPGGLWNIPWSSWLKKSALTSVTGSVDVESGNSDGSLADAAPVGA